MSPLVGHVHHFHGPDFFLYIYFDSFWVVGMYSWMYFLKMTHFVVQELQRRSPLLRRLMHSLWSVQLKRRRWVDNKLRNPVFNLFFFKCDSLRVLWSLLIHKYFFFFFLIRRKQRQKSRRRRKMEIRKRQKWRPKVSPVTFRSTVLPAWSTLCRRACAFCNFAK